MKLVILWRAGKHKPHSTHCALETGFREKGSEALEMWPNPKLCDLLEDVWEVSVLAISMFSIDHIIPMRRVNLALVGGGAENLGTDRQ